MYTCGLTVYSQPHIGNWVGYIYWDVLVRLLRWQDIPVVRTQNITDVGHLTSDDDDGEDCPNSPHRVQSSLFVKQLCQLYHSIQLGLGS